MKYENKQYEAWEELTYVICEVLAWRGIWLSEERRRMGNVDVGRAEYLARTTAHLDPRPPAILTAQTFLGTPRNLLLRVNEDGVCTRQGPARVW